MSTFSRKYRPQNFDEVVGQNHIKITLQNEIQTGKVANAYLFCGPRGTGKTTFSRVFVKAINCQNRKEADFNPCGQCENCRNITVGSSLDVVEIDAASHTGVDNVRENIIASARVAPSKCKYRAFIIDEVHMLSISAFNALLKIIEEPPKNVIFILCTTEVHKVPTTIISRCQRFDFKRIGVSDMVRKLEYIVKHEKIKIDKTILESIARHSDGDMRDAESLLRQIVSIGGNDITAKDADLVIPRSDLNEIVNLIELLVKKDAFTSIMLINKLIDGGIDLKAFLNDMIELLRKIMVIKINPTLIDKLGLEMGESIEIKLNETIKQIDINFILLLLNKIIEAAKKVKESFITQLPLEMAIAEICLSSVSIPAQPTSNSKINNIVPPQTIKTNNLPPVANLPNQDINLSIDDIIKKWKEVLLKVKNHNHSLSFVLQACQPINIKGNQLCLAFKYKFHKDRITEVQVRTLAEKILSDVYGTNLLIEAVIGEVEPTIATLEKKEDVTQNIAAVNDISNDSAVNDSSDNSMLNNLLQTFNGKVVK